MSVLIYSAQENHGVLSLRRSLWSSRITRAGTGARPYGFLACVLLRIEFRAPFIVYNMKRKTLLAL